MLAYFDEKHPMNCSHIINHLSFGEDIDIPGHRWAFNPLDSIKKIVPTSEGKQNHFKWNAFALFSVVYRSIWYNAFNIVWVLYQGCSDYFRRFVGRNNLDLSVYSEFQLARPELSDGKIVCIIIDAKMLTFCSKAGSLFSLRFLTNNSPVHTEENRILPLPGASLCHHWRYLHCSRACESIHSQISPHCAEESARREVRLNCPLTWVK